MKKKLFFAAVALVALAGCSSDDFVGDSSLQGSGESPISFGFDVPTVTRASGAEAATKLSNQFIVYGEKSETADGAAPATGNLVFQNYKVAYTSNTAYTTQSNTKDWEYVGQQWTNDESSNIITSTADLQTIKYWDYSASNYVFTAVSALPADISSGRVKITKTTSATSDNKVYDKGYTITLAKTTGSPAVYPTLSDIYISDRLVINQSSGSDRNAMNAYGGNVTLTFRNLLSQVRAGVYETIPGYGISSIKFYVTNDAEAKVGEDPTPTPAFGAICPNVKIGGGFEGTLNVTYYGAGTAAENQPKVAVSGGSGSATDLILGTNMNTLNKTTPTLLGTTAVSPTWDTEDGAYTNVLPQSVDNTTNLKLKCDYTLWNSVTGETIEVKGATAEIPSQYLQWKSNFKYTYLFKISDNTNGSTGQDVTGLYPITFDAVEMVNGDGVAEYITTVSEPSITTFGAIYNGTKYTNYVTGGDEYTATGIASGSQLNIFATFMEGSTVKTPTLGGTGAQHVNIYSVTSADPTNFKITEASVAEAIANPVSITNNVYTCTVTYTKVTDATTLAAGTNYYKSDGTHAPGTTGYVTTLAVSETDYHVDATPASSTIADGVDIYTCAVTSVTEVTDATTLAAGTTYYKKDTNTKAPGEAGYIPTIAVEGTDYQVAPKITAINITTYDTDDTYFTGNVKPAVVGEVPGEDGVNKTIDALKLTGVKAGTYAIEYEASAAWTGTYKKVYKVIRVN